MTTEQADVPQDTGRPVQLQVQEAIEPVLTNFRTQLEQTVRKQLEETMRQDAQHVSPGRAEADSSAVEQPAVPAQTEPPQVNSAARASEGERQQDQDVPQEAEPKGEVPQEAEPLEAEPKDSVDDSSNNSPGLVTRALNYVEDEGQQWLASLLQMGLDVLFSESIRRPLQEQAEQGLQDLLHEAYEALPGDSDEDGARLKTEEEAQRILQETFDSLFAGSIRAEVERSGSRAIQALLEGDLDAAREGAELALQSLLTGFFDILQQHWGKILRLVFRVLMQSLQEAFASTVKEKLSGISLGPGKEADEKAESVQEQFQEKSEELRERMHEAVTTIHDRVSEETEELQRRLKEGLQSGVREGTKNKQLGKAPLGRPGRPPSGRPPSGRPPSLRPPSGP